MILALLFLFVSIAFGYAIVRAIGFAESREEEAAVAIALGLPLTAVIAFVFFLAVGGAAPFAALLIEGAAAAWILFKKKTGGGRKLGSSPGFWLRFVPFVIVLTLFFANGAMRFDDNGGLTVSSAFYEDSYYHVSLMQYYSFSGGEAAPLQDPQYAGAPIGYPFLTDFYSAMLQRLGFDFPLAFVLPAFVMIIAFYAVFYFFVLRLSRNRNAAFCAVALLFFSGAFAYPLMIQDASEQGFAQWIAKPAHDYAAIEENGKLGNVTQFTRAYLIAQRSSDFGYAVALVVLVLLFEAVRENTKGAKNETKRRKLLLAAGVLTGLTPFMRETAFYACVAVAAVLALLFIDVKRLKRWASDWAFFALPCVALVAPQLPFFIGGAANAGYVSVALGWKAHSANPLEIALFWIRTLGLPTLFALAGFALARRDVKKYYLAFIPLFLAANVFSFTPDPLNNMKIINFWEMPTFALAGIALGALWRDDKKEKPRNRRKLVLAALAAAVLLVAILPGVFSLWQNWQEKFVLYSSEDYAFSQWANAALPRDAILVSVGGPHALDLVGRARVSGFPAIGWIKGRADWYDRVLAVRSVYAGNNICETARKYGATHAVVTESERSLEEFNAAALANDPALKKIYSQQIGSRYYEVYEINC
ncbi:MAG: hypothetical protein V1817_02535 [Candidatus Micrarchaeota archaeon]